MSNTDKKLNEIFDGEGFELNGEILTREKVINDCYFYIEELKKHFKEN